MKKVITYGTFDLFHYGHLQIIKRAKILGDYLIVAVSSDEFNILKGKKCTYTFQHRAEIVNSLKYVDEVIQENNWEQKIFDINKHHIDIFVMGDDWKGKFDYLSDYCQVIYLPRTPDISTTDIKYSIASKLKGI